MKRDRVKAKLTGKKTLKMGGVGAKMKLMKKKGPAAAGKTLGSKIGMKPLQKKAPLKSGGPADLKVRRKVIQKGGGKPLGRPTPVKNPERKGGAPLKQRPLQRPQHKQGGPGKVSILFSASCFLTTSFFLSNVQVSKNSHDHLK